MQTKEMVMTFREISMVKKLILATMALAMATLFIASPMAQSVSDILLSPGVKNFIKFVFAFVAAVQIFALVSDIITGDGGGKLIGKILSIAFSIYMATSYSSFISLIINF